MSDNKIAFNPYLNVIAQEHKEFLKELGGKIAYHRSKQNLSKVQLAFEIGTSESNIRRIEKGEINVGIITLLKVSNALNITLSELIA